MIRRTTAYFRAAMEAAPVLHLPFDGPARIVERSRMDEITSGVITLLPIAIFLQECRFTWERLSH